MGDQKIQIKKKSKYFRIKNILTDKLEHHNQKDQLQSHNLVNILYNNLIKLSNTLIKEIVAKFKNKEILIGQIYKFKIANKSLLFLKNPIKIKINMRKFLKHLIQNFREIQATLKPVMEEAR